jgi:hypothetical protein
MDGLGRKDGQRWHAVRVGSQISLDKWTHAQPTSRLQDNDRIVLLYLGRPYKPNKQYSKSPTFLLFYYYWRPRSTGFVLTEQIRDLLDQTDESSVS